MLNQIKSYTAPIATEAIAIVVLSAFLLWAFAITIANGTENRGFGSVAPAKAPAQTLASCESDDPEKNPCPTPTVSPSPATMMMR